MNVQVFSESVNSKLVRNNDIEKRIGVNGFGRISKYYSKNINLLGCLQLEINILEIDGLRIGVWFCDYAKIKKSFFHPFMYVPSSSDLFRREVGVDGFWFVLTGGELTREFKAVNEFIDKYNLRERYDEVFLFSYFGETTPHSVMI